MEDKILNLFLYNKELKFSDIEKLLNIRSNKLAYHIKKLVKKNILFKEGDYYSLSQSSEYLMPYLSKKNSLLPVVLVAIKNSERKFFLYERFKRPFKGFLSLPGGRVLSHENIDEASIRIMKEKHSLDIKPLGIRNISLEYVKKNDRLTHSFLLFFVSAKIVGKVSDENFLDINKNKSLIIPSDYELINLYGNSRKNIQINPLISEI